MPGRASSIDEGEIRHLAAVEFGRRHRAEITATADRFEAEIGRGSGLAAQGLAAVCAALRDGNVDTLIVGELGDTTVVTGKALTTVAPDADALSELGEPVARVARADEALPLPRFPSAPAWCGPIAESHPQTASVLCSDTSLATRRQSIVKVNSTFRDLCRLVSGVIHEAF